MDLEKKLKLLPTKPGVYLMKNAGGRDYLRGQGGFTAESGALLLSVQPQPLPPRYGPWWRISADFEYIVTDSEVEALILEFNLIQQHSPWYNVRLKDDKRYPYLKVTLNETFPG